MLTHELMILTHFYYKGKLGDARFRNYKEVESISYKPKITCQMMAALEITMLLSLLDQLDDRPYFDLIEYAKQWY